jgi:uncharacterized Zn finger protein
MKCPTCTKTTRVEVSLKADGFAESLLECGHCGAIWTLKGGSALTIVEGSRQSP